MSILKINVSSDRTNNAWTGIRGVVNSESNEFL